MRNVIKAYDDLVSKSINEGKNDDGCVSLSKEALISFEFYDYDDFNKKFFKETEYLAMGDSCYLRRYSCFPKISHDEREDIYNIERYEREMIINDLKFATHINMSKFNEPTDSRRFLTTNDSCLSFTQVSVNDDSFRWVFVSRSTEINKMLPADLHTIAHIIKEWTQWFFLYNKKKYIHDRKIAIMLIMTNPHYYTK